MRKHTHLVLLGSILLAASLLFAFTPLASTAFAATTGTRITSRAHTIIHETTPLLAPINPCPPSQSEGSNNTWVKVIQFRLNEIDSAGLRIDGSFGSNTKRAVVNFQDAVGIGASGGGVVGTRTWSALGFCLGYSTIILGFTNTTSLTNCPPSQSQGGSNDQTFVEALQALLNIDFNFNVFPNSPDNFHPFLSFDGIFGSNTKSAAVDFQDAVGIGASGGGVVGQRTWSELGMCF